MPSEVQDMIEELESSVLDGNRGFNFFRLNTLYKVHINLSFILGGYLSSVPTIKFVLGKV